VRVTLQDDSLPHQIRLFMIGHEIAVSCNCLRGVDGGWMYAPIEVRGCWETAEALGAWRRWHELPRVSEESLIGCGQVTA
jgi:hypothetical protein